MKQLGELLAIIASVTAIVVTFLRNNHFGFGGQFSMDQLRQFKLLIQLYEELNSPLDRLADTAEVSTRTVTRFLKDPSRISSRYRDAIEDGLKKICTTDSNYPAAYKKIFGSPNFSITSVEFISTWDDRGKQEIIDRAIEFYAKKNSRNDQLSWNKHEELGIR